MDIGFKNELLGVLELLDVNEDNHWTTDGRPRLEIVSQLMKLEVKRRMVQAVAPDFTREVPTLPKPEVEEPKKELETYESQEVKTNEIDGVEDTIDFAKVPNTKALNTKSLDERQEEIDELTKILNQDRVRLDQIIRNIKKTEELRDTKIAEMRTEFPPLSQADATRMHVESQLKQRMARAEMSRRLQEMTGFNVLNAKSPLDAAMSARKSTRMSQINVRDGANGADK